VDWHSLGKVVADNLEKIAALFAILGLSIWGVVRYAGSSIAGFFRGVWTLGRLATAIGETEMFKYELSISPDFKRSVIIRGTLRGNAIVYEIPFYCKMERGHETPQYGVYVNIPLPYSVMGSSGTGTVTAQSQINTRIAAGGMFFNETVFSVRAPDKRKVTTELGKISVSPNLGAPNEVEILWHIKYNPPQGRYPYNREEKMRIHFQPPSPEPKP